MYREKKMSELIPIKVSPFISGWLKYTDFSILFFNELSIRLYTLPKILFFILLFVVVSLMPLNSESRIVRVGVFPAAPLVMIIDGKPEGLFIDLIEYFSLKLHWRIQYVEGTWSNLLVSLEKGEIDLLPAVGFTTERLVKYDFSKNPVYIDSGVLFTNPKFTVHTIFDLQEKRVAALKGSIFTTGFINYITSFGVKCDIVLTDNNEAVMQSISNGEVDAGVCIYSLGNELARNFSVAITPISFSPIALEFAVPKGRNSDLIAGIDLLMPPMIIDPDSIYSKSYRKWTMQPSSYKLPIWFWWGILGLLILGIFLVSWNFILKQQVNLKTRHLELEISERKQAEKKILQALSEKETLLRELYHRTKNTMQVIRGLFILQAIEFPTNKELQQLVKNTEDRIQVISLVHQMLYKSHDLSRISIKEYTEELTSLILQSFGIYNDRISLNININDQYFLLDTAIPFGLILNELMTNSLRHAFPDNRKGIISINLTNDGQNKNILEYSDNGVGVPDGFDFRNQNTLGLKLIHSIVEMQMMGKVIYKNNNGVSCLIEISTDLYEVRV